MRPTIFSLLLILILSVAAIADTKVTQVNKVDALKMMGKEMPAKSDTAIIWFGANGVSFKSAEGSSIIRHDLGLMYILMPDKKQYAEFSLSEIASMKSIIEQTAGDEGSASLDSMLGDVSFDKIYKEVGDSAQAYELLKMAEGVKGMFGDSGGKPMISAQVTVTDEKKKIGEFDCRKYLVTMNMIMGMTMKQEIWASEDVDIDYQSLVTAMSSMKASMTGFSETMHEMKKIKGLPILTIGSLSMMGSETKMTGEVLSVEEGDAPAGTFDVPAGFKKVDLSSVAPH